MEPIYIIILFAGGILEGLYASTVGGGALVSIPLLFLTGLPIHVVIATNRLAAVFLEASSALRYYKEKALNIKYGVLFGLIAATGSFIGSNLVIKIDEKHLSLAAAILLLAVFAILMFKKQFGVTAQKMSRRHWILACIFTFLLGIYGGFFGAGFGTFITIVFILTGLSLLNSAAISRVVGLLMSVSAAIVFIFNGLVNYPYALSLGIGVAIGGWIGAGIAVKKGSKYVKLLLVIVILFTAGKLAMDFAYAG